MLITRTMTSFVTILVENLASFVPSYSNLTGFLEDPVAINSLPTDLYQHLGARSIVNIPNTYSKSMSLNYSSPATGVIPFFFPSCPLFLLQFGVVYAMTILEIAVRYILCFDPGTIYTSVASNLPPTNVSADKTMTFWDHSTNLQGSFGFSVVNILLANSAFAFSSFYQFKECLLSSTFIFSGLLLFLAELSLQLLLFLYPQLT